MGWRELGPGQWHPQEELWVCRTAAAPTARPGSQFTHRRAWRSREDPEEKAALHVSLRSLPELRHFLNKFQNIHFVRVHSAIHL